MFTLGKGFAGRQLQPGGEAAMLRLSNEFLREHQGITDPLEATGPPGQDWWDCTLCTHSGISLSKAFR